MRNRLLGSEPLTLDLGLLLLRVIVGVGMALHGYDKIFGVNEEGVRNLVGFAGMVGGFGFPGSPTFWAWAAALSELVGGAMIALGLFTRVAAVFVAIVLVVAIWQVKSARGWMGGYELDLLYIAGLATLFLTGPGAFSLDAALFRRPRYPRPAYT